MDCLGSAFPLQIRSGPPPPARPPGRRLSTASAAGPIGRSRPFVTARTRAGPAGGPPCGVRRLPTRMRHWRAYVRSGGAGARGAHPLPHGPRPGTRAEAPPRSRPAEPDGPAQPAGRAARARRGRLGGGTAGFDGPSPPNLKDHLSPAAAESDLRVRVAVSESPCLQVARAATPRLLTSVGSDSDLLELEADSDACGSLPSLLSSVRTARLCRGDSDPDSDPTRVRHGVRVSLSG